MTNIFKNAKFGDKFRTRDGRMAVYQKSVWTDEALLILPDYDLTVWIDGSCRKGKECSLDITGKWHEEINEEELDRLVESEIQSIKSKSDFDTDVCMIIERNKSWFIDGFERGYRKAKEE